MFNNPDKITWQLSRLGEAIKIIASRSGLSSQTTDPPIVPDDFRWQDEAELRRWIETVSRMMGIEASPMEALYTEIDKLTRSAEPALFRLPGDGEPKFLVILGGRRRISILGPDLKIHRLNPEIVHDILCKEIEDSHTAEIDRIVKLSGIPDKRREQVKKAIMQKYLSQTRLGGHWIFRLSPGAGIRDQIRHTNLFRQLLFIISAHIIQYSLWILSWWAIGRGVLQDKLDYVWFVVWIFLLIFMIAFRIQATWLQGRFSMGMGAIIKKRLIYGTMKIEPEIIRHQGVGQLTGRVIESESVESLAITGGFLSVFSGVELVIAAFVLFKGAGSWFHVLLLSGWMLIAFAIGWRYFLIRRRWTEARLGMTNDLVERMEGHRTRLVQQAPEHWHDGENEMVGDYLSISKRMDRNTVLLNALVPYGWLIFGLIGIVQGVISDQASVNAIALSLGGIMLVFRSLQGLVTGLSHIGDAVISWEQIAPFYYSAAQPEAVGSLAPIANKDSRPLMDIHSLTYRHSHRPEPIIHSCNLRINSGDRILLEGESGGGKSTLVALFAGLRIPESGAITLNGLDRQTLGAEGWRRFVTVAPQFNENHVFIGPFAFNLLMGRKWPPTAKDFEEAEAICRELGLSALLERMPAGMLQMVGESGWQLSHGEKSRLYIARALLQNSRLIILDESFASLDPETFTQSINCVSNRANTLLVIAHP